MPSVNIKRLIHPFINELLSLAGYNSPSLLHCKSLTGLSTNEYKQDR